MMTTSCIDCGVKLTVENRSSHQGFRCHGCFRKHSTQVKSTLKGMIADLDRKKESRSCHCLECQVKRGGGQ